MIRVCHISSAHKNTDTRIFHKECVSLAKSGYEVFLVCQGEDGNREGVNLIGLRTPHGRRDRILRLTKEAYEKAVDVDADIYHLHDPELLPYAVKLKRKGKSVIFDSHEDIFNDIKEKNYLWKPFRYLISYTLKLYCSIVYRKLDAIITVTPHICDQLKKMNQEVRLITNYPVFTEGDHPYSGTRTICFAGGISRDWMHHNVIDALAACSPVKYLLCGKASKEYLDELRRLGGWEQVDYRGIIPFSEVQGIYREASIGIALLQYMLNVGSHKGTLGNTKLFEYMMAGLPVICTDFTLWKEIVEEYRCGICVDPNRVDKIADAIMYLLDNPSKAEQMGRNGYNAVKMKYNWQNEEKKLLELYERIMKRA